MLVYGIWLALAGGIALVAGLTATRRRHRLQRSGQLTWAMILPTPADHADADRTSAVSVQFALDDGRVIDSGRARPVGASGPLRPGDQVLVWYDQADPSDVLIDGDDGPLSDRVFLIAGAVLVALGVILAGVGR